MRKILTICILGLLFFTGISHVSGQKVKVTMATLTVDSNSVAAVDVTTDNFTNLLGITFSINYDSTVLEFQNVTGFNAALGLSIGSFGLPGTGLVKKGQITFSWNSATGNPASLQAGTKLFTLNLKAIGRKCKTSDVNTSNTPAKINIVYGNLTEDANLENVKGVVTIKCGTNPPVTDCPSPACTDPTKMALIGATVNVKKDETICVPISVKNFKLMQSGQGSIKWDPTVLQYTGNKTPASGGIPDFNAFNDGNAANGEFKYVWANTDPGKPVTLPDNTVVLELCFKAIGAEGATGCVLVGQGTLLTEWENDNGTLISPCLVYGKVKIDDPNAANPVLLKVNPGTGSKGTVVCQDVTVDNFKDIFGANTKFSWDAAQLKFLRTEAYNLTGLNASAFSNVTNALNFLWTNPDGVTVANGTKIFKMCFELTGACDANAAIDVPGPTEFIGKVGGSPANVPGSATGASIKITCDPVTLECNPGAIVQPTCFGSANASVVMSVLNSTNDCVFQWKNSAGTNVKTGLVTSGTNLTNIPAGTYTFEVFCSGVSKCKKTITIDQPAAIVIPVANAVTNVSCSQKGAINISTTTGGTTPYTYNWNPAQTNTPTVSNLNEGAYAVTVTDANGCTSSANFTITNNVPALAVSTSVTAVKCKGDATGAIQLTVTGGCPGYTFTWSNGLTGNNPQNVKAGTYSVTVTDTSNPAQTKTATVTITEPATALSAAVASKTDASSATAADGKVSITVSGGTPNYSTKWAGPSTVTDGILDAISLKAGSYAVTVTDANGCTAVVSQVVGVKTTQVDTIPKFASAAVTSNFSGFGVKCFGESNGTITAKLSAGTYPVSVVLKAGSQAIGSPKVINSPDVVFTGLAAGSYTLEATNPAGTITSSSVNVTQPTKLNAIPSINCTDKNGATGTISLNMNNTGAGNYSFSWSGLTDLDNLVENLPKGAYNVTITDANGCTLTATNLEVKDCAAGGDCYTASTVMTPNGDNYNDLFIINCVEDAPADLTVFDRWGRTVYTKINYDNTWQGINTDGTELKEGGYMWVLNVNFGQGRREVYKGTVTILRTN